MILADSSVVLDVLGEDQRWRTWSVSMLGDALARDKVVINDIVYAEIAAGFRTAQELDRALGGLGLEVAPISRTAFFLAGHAFKRYRLQRGPRTAVLPDFFIGAHAAVAGAALLTRDPSRVRAYFPAVEIVAPMRDL